MIQTIDDIVERQLIRWHSERESVTNLYHKRHRPTPVITISRLLGSGASEIAKAVAREMNCELVGIRIMDEIAIQSNTGKALVDAMDERVNSQLKEWIDKVIHSRETFDASLHQHHLFKIINYFMQMGNVVLLGRGAGFLPRTRPRLDVRIVAPDKFRIRRIMKLQHCSEKAAMRILNESDTGRTQFVQQIFNEDWWDTRRYDLVINTASIRIEGSVAMIKAAWADMANAVLDIEASAPVTARS